MYVQRLCDLVERAGVWLWPNRLALGKLAILDAVPGLGKSLVVLDLCARITSGLPMPDAQVGSAPANVLIINAEDGDSDTLRPRLRAMGADLQRTFVASLNEGNSDTPRLPRFPADAAIL